MKSVGIKGLSSYVPERIMTNFEFEKIIDTSDEWIRTRTGIEERRFASPEQATSDLCYEATQKLLASMKMDPQEIDFIMVCTCTPDYPVPSTACVLQSKLNLSGVPAVDINAACSGFMYGLTMATSMVQTGLYKNVLVIGAETLSRVMDMQDRNTCVLFGDGAAAAIIGEVEEGSGILATHLGAEGEDEGILQIPGGGSRYPSTLESVHAKKQFVQMKGQNVYKFAVHALLEATLAALEKAKVEASQIARFFPHQANLRIIEAAAKRMNVSSDKFHVNLHKVGNTSAASVGLALADALEKGMVKKGDYIALTGFGAGLTYGSVVMKWAY